MKYDAVIEPNPAGGWAGWVVNLPAFGAGRTIEDLKQDLTYSAEFCVEQLTRLGEPVPPPARYEGGMEPGWQLLRKAIEVEIPALAPVTRR